MDNFLAMKTLVLTQDQLDEAIAEVESCLDSTGEPYDERLVNAHIGGGLRFAFMVEPSPGDLAGCAGYLARVTAAAICERQEKERERKARPWWKFW